MLSLVARWVFVALLMAGPALSFRSKGLSWSRFGHVCQSTTSGIDSQKQVSTAPEPYVGPVSSMDSMIAGCDVEDLGLQILLGPSKVCDGLGLFVRVNDDTETSVQPRGTPLCGYSKGTMVEEAFGKFTVAYYFTSEFNGVMFEKKLMPLFEAIGIVAERNKAFHLQDIVEGHKLLWDPETEKMRIEAVEEDASRYFIPDPVEAGESGLPVWGPSNLGMYANDCGYSEEADEAEYQKQADIKNVLQITWRLIEQGGKLVPSWPVVVTSKDVVFENKEPMEVGLKYGWMYWAAARMKREKGEVGALS